MDNVSSDVLTIDGLSVLYKLVREGNIPSARRLALGRLTDHASGDEEAVRGMPYTD